MERLLEQVGAFLSRFTLLYEKPSQPRQGLDQIAVNMLAHLFYVLALTTKFLMKSRISLSPFHINTQVSYLPRNTGHYLYVLIGFPDDLNEALRKMDVYAIQENMMINAKIFLAVEPSE